MAEEIKCVVEFERSRTKTCGAAYVGLESVGASCR